MFEGSSEIEALPPYLCVQMVRFFYKADVQQKAKILRKVSDEGLAPRDWAAEARARGRSDRNTGRGRRGGNGRPGNPAPGIR